MKKIIVALALCGVFIIGAQAQVKREADPLQMTQSKQKKGKLIKDLDLTKEQRSQIKEFHKAINQQKESIANDNTLSDEQKKSKLKELRKDERKKINSILTLEQKEKLKEQKKNAKK
jgi:Spy/CpxP family protein refolding chaperone